MTTPAFSNAGNGNATTSTGTIAPPFPAVVVADQWALLQVVVRNGTTTPDTPTGWTLMYGPDASGSTTSRQWLYHLDTLTAGTEDSSTVTISFSSDAAVSKAARIYTFDTPYSATSFEAGAATSGTGTQVSMPTVATTGNERLAIACITVADNNTIDSSSGESGGDWQEAAAEYTDSGDTGVCLQIQTAAMATGGTISGGQTPPDSSDPWAARAFALSGISTATPKGLVMLMGDGGFL